MSLELDEAGDELVVLLGGSGRDFTVARDGRRGNDRVKEGPGVDRCRTDHVRVCP
ncbi:MAG TPA: hypothetical protein VFL61_04390 [Gaiellaceae bacterium]|nr:hypothetical protein [Gaiellaceae bacterium]